MAAQQFTFLARPEFPQAFAKAIDRMIDRVARVFAESQDPDSSNIDPYLYLASVKAHLADHFPMTQGDADAWHLCDRIQMEVL